MERHWQLLSGDKRFIRVRMCIVIRLLLLLLLLPPILTGKTWEVFLLLLS